MKKWAAFLTVLAMGVCVQTSDAYAAETPSCVVMKFTDDTRFDKVESAASLSDLVMEKLLTSGKFNLKETKAIDADLEKRLYDERAEELRNAKQAMANGNFDVLFEGPGFNENKAQSIASASVGQYVSPSIIHSIGQTNGVDYLIQGTIQNIGSGDWMNDVASTVSSLVASYCPGLPSFDMKETNMGVQAELRVIKASTGKVVWHKSVSGVKTKTTVGVGGLKIGSDKLDSKMYYAALDITAQKIVDALVEDYEAGKLFVE